MKNIDTYLDIYWTFILPVICLFSIVTNLINIKVFYALKSKNIIYKYMLYNSLSNVAYLLTVVFVFVIKCGRFCEDLKDSYIAKVYHQYIFIFLSNSLGLFCLFTEIVISMQRIIFIKNVSRKWCCSINFVLIGLLVFSFAFNLPHVFLAQIKPVYISHSNNTDTVKRKLVYVREPIQIFKKNASIKFLLGFQVGFRLLLSLILLSTLNYLTYFYFKKRASKKKLLQNAFLQKEQQKNLTKESCKF